MVVQTSDKSLLVETIRVACHKKGEQSDGMHANTNHWSLYLFTKDGGAVRLNMSASNTGRGIFSTTVLGDRSPLTQTRAWDYKTAEGVTVGKILDLIESKGRHNYLMTSEGFGCRHWLLTVIHDLAEAGIIAMQDYDEVAVNILFNYPTYNYPTFLPLHEGTFCESNGNRLE